MNIIVQTEEHHYDPIYVNKFNTTVPRRVIVHTFYRFIISGRLLSKCKFGSTYILTYEFMCELSEFIKKIKELVNSEFGLIVTHSSYMCDVPKGKIYYDPDVFFQIRIGTLIYSNLREFLDAYNIQYIRYESPPF